jgi:membrane protein YqaA with SNARE-associated domain
MRLFSSLYKKMIHWSHHRHAPYYLGIVSFTESSFFPIPPDVMLAPMALARPERAWQYAGITTISAVLGAFLGYLIGMYFFKGIEPLMTYFGYMPAYLKAQSWFAVWGGWVMFVAASVSPVPFKLFTIAGGALHMSLWPFLAGSALGRAGRYFLVAGLMRLGGEKMHRWLERSVDWIGWVVLGLLVVGGVVYWGMR